MEEKPNMKTAKNIKTNDYYLEEIIQNAIINAKGMKVREYIIPKIEKEQHTVQLVGKGKK